MSMNLETLFKKEAFRHLNQDQQQTFINAMGTLKNATPAQAMPVLLSVISTIQKSKPLSAAAQKEMMAAMIETLPPEDKARFTALLQWFENTRPV